MEKPAFSAVMIEDFRCRVNEGDVEKLASNGFGELVGSQLILWPEEALYLLERGALKLLDRDGTLLDFKTYLDHISRANPGLWPLYIIYRDLRRSQRIVKKGFGGRLTYRLYEPSNRETSKYIILAFPEGTILKVEEIVKAARQVMRKGKVLVIAVLDRRGEVIYYSCSDTNLSNL